MTNDAIDRGLSEDKITAAVEDFHDRIEASVNEIQDATPCWAKLDWANGQIARLENEVSRRDAVLDWIAANVPRALELCPYKLVRE